MMKRRLPSSTQLSSVSRNQIIKKAAENSNKIIIDDSFFGRAMKDVDKKIESEKSASQNYQRFIHRALDDLEERMEILDENEQQEYAKNIKKAIDDHFYEIIDGKYNYEDFSGGVDTPVTHKKESVKQTSKYVFD